MLYIYVNALLPYKILQLLHRNGIVQYLQWTQGLRMAIVPFYMSVFVRVLRLCHHHLTAVDDTDGFLLRHIGVWTSFLRGFSHSMRPVWRLGRSISGQSIGHIRFGIGIKVWMIL